MFHTGQRYRNVCRCQEENKNSKETGNGVRARSGMPNGGTAILKAFPFSHPKLISQLPELLLLRVDFQNWSQGRKRAYRKVHVIRFCIAHCSAGMCCTSATVLG
jgi:hypothetical protein